MPFGKTYNSDNKQFCLYITITLKNPNEKKKFRVWAEELNKQNSKYADRDIEINADDKGKRRIYFSFPISPKQLFIGVVNSQEPNDNSFTVDLMEAPLKTYDIELNDETKRFLSFATKFSTICGYSEASEFGRSFVSPGKEFTIKFFPVIRDRMSGQPLNTPARIGHETGFIDIAKNKFDNYTIPMRMIILLHEFSHKYRNPKVGLEISNEKGADVNALYIYLGKGWSKIDSLICFSRVFLGAQTPSNISRLRLINDYCNRFDNQEFAALN